MTISDTYLQNPDGYLSSWISGFVQDYATQFDQYHGLTSDSRPDDLDDHAWEVILLWDKLAKKLFGATSNLATLDDAAQDALDMLRGIGWQAEESLFVRQRFELEFALDFDWGFLDMADRAIELIQYLVDIENHRARLYLQRVADCYVRDLPTETVIMCGAVLEAALEDFADDDTVRRSLRLEDGQRVFSGHRLRHIERKRLMPAHWINRAGEILDDRNTAIHFTPGLVVNAEPVVANLAWLLKKLPG